MELVLDENGHVKVQDGKPIYKHSDGQERPFDAAYTVATINRLNGEAKGHRERAEKAESTLKVFDGLDADAARKALETVSNLDSKQLIAAGEVEKVKAEAKAAFDEQLRAVEAKYKPVVEERDTLNAKLIERTIGGAFDGSKYITDKLAVPAPMVKATFGQNFKVEGDAMVGYDSHGTKLYSRERPGEIAGFEEALSMLVEASPFRDSILKGSGASGGGAPGSGGAAGAKTISRQQFDGMGPAERSSFLKGGGKLTDN